MKKMTLKVLAAALVAATFTLIGAATPAHSAPSGDSGTRWDTAALRLPPGSTNVQQHEVNRFDFTLPCVTGNPYHVVTTSDVTVTVQRAIPYPGTGLKMIYAFTDTGTYVASSDSGRVIRGWFLDTYTASAIRPVGDAPDRADRYDQTRTLILTAGGGRLLFEDDMSLHARHYDAATDAPHEQVTCG